jgi:hypothetical protein
MSIESEIIHHICEKEEITETVIIKCHNCINNINGFICCKSGESYSYDCSCKHKSITTLVCRNCESLKDLIANLKDELDELLYWLSVDIKKYYDCNNRIGRIEEISKLLREYNSILLEKI